MTQPSINATAFPATPSDHFWTNTVFMADVGYPWFVRFDFGSSAGDLRSAAKNIRCVRGGLVPLPTRFIRSFPVQNEPVVRDELTGLEWQGCVAELLGANCELGLDQTKSWADALKYCESLDWGGHDDWRLPDIEQAVSIVDNTRSKPAVEPAAFPGTPGVNAVYFWASTPSLSGAGYAWSTHSATGMTAPNNVASKVNLRCVRGGRCYPACAGKCGGASDGCGGQCSGCGSGQVCDNMACVHCGFYGEPCCENDVCIGANVCQSGKCVADSCLGKPDFTLCNVVTSPDRDYDICVDESCISPGCGDATCNAPGPHFPMPDSGQRKCYDGSAETTCPAGSGTPCNADGSPQYCGQDAQFGWDVAHQPGERFNVTNLVSDEPLVQDNVTGLEWTGCAAGLKGGGCNTGAAIPMDWEGALDYCNALPWGGKTDWRLPDRFEVMTIVDFSRVNPAARIDIFPSLPPSSFWLSATSAYEQGKALNLVADSGFGQYQTKTQLDYVLCVRGVPRSLATRFIRRQDVPNQPIVEDKATGLVWQGCASGLEGGICSNGTATTPAWTDALAYCESLDRGGAQDWRLPNVVELHSVVQHRNSPTVDQLAFPGSPPYFYWSSSTAAAVNGEAWLAGFNVGIVVTVTKTNGENVRCVRGQP